MEAVFCLSHASCWAVGYYERNGAWLNQALHWNGRRWSRASIPSPGGAASGDTSELFGVRCIASGSCWAVGYYERHGAALDEALHWNGRKWSWVATPTPGGTLSDDFNDLFDVTCVSASNCWAAGEYGNLSIEDEVTANQALHWNGKRWSEVATPDPAGTFSNDVNALQSVRCAAARNCWAVGTYGTAGSTVILSNEVLHWNGRKWHRVSVPDPGGTASGDFSELQGLSCTSAVNCWAAGAEGILSTSFNQILHWNGKKWSQAAVPDPDGTGPGASNTLAFVTCSARKNCWAVGNIHDSSSGTFFDEALRWNGTSWLPAKGLPEPGGTASGAVNMLIGARCTSAANCWAVGIQQKSGRAQLSQVLHFNGARWSTG
jgi:hypothetical protein